MFMTIHTITCPPGAAEFLERAFAPAANLEGVPGFVRSRLLKNTREGELLEYLAIYEWAGRAAFEAWTKSESFRQTGQDAAPGLPTVETETYETVG